MSKVIAITNQKGGVGKTTTSVNLSAALAKMNYKVLLIDMDPQANATQGIGIDRDYIELSTYHVLTGEVGLEKVIQHSYIENLDVAPGEIDLAGIDLELAHVKQGREVRLKQSLDKIKDYYDFVFIDCPPALGLLNTNALTSCDTVLIPVQCEYYALEGLTQLLNTIKLTQNHFNKKLSIEGLLLTMLDQRTNLGLEVSQEVRKYFKEKVYKTVIPRNIKLSEAPSAGICIFDYDGSSVGAQAYKELAKEVAEKKKKLNKGLDAIFGGDITSLIDDIEHNTPESSQEKIKLDEIRPNPYQPRKVFDEQALNELALSIQEHGIFQPVILKKSVQGYEIVAGERRCRAARMAHLAEVPAIIVDFSDQQMMEIALLENIQREDLNAIEEAQAYQTMMEKLKLTQNELAKRIGKSRTHITNTLRLLNLPEKIQEYVLDGSLSMGHARALITLDKERALKIAKRVIDEKLSVRDVENIVKGFELQEARKNKPKVEKSKEYQYVEGLLRKKYRTRIKVDDKSITIKYSDTDDLNRLLELMGVIEES